MLPFLPELAACDVVRHLRAPRTQGELAHLLSVTRSKISDWETGRVAARWRDLALLCAALGHPVDEKRILIELLVAVDATAVLGRSRQTVTRWRSGRSSPTLADVMVLLYAARRLTDFVHTVTARQVKELPSLRRVGAGY